MFSRVAAHQSNQVEFAYLFCHLHVFNVLLFGTPCHTLSHILWLCLKFFAYLLVLSCSTYIPVLLERPHYLLPPLVDILTFTLTRYCTDCLLIPSLYYASFQLFCALHILILVSTVLSSLHYVRILPQLVLHSIPCLCVSVTLESSPCFVMFLINIASQPLIVLVSPAVRHFHLYSRTPDPYCLLVCLQFIVQHFCLSLVRMLITFLSLYLVNPVKPETTLLAWLPI